MAIADHDAEFDTLDAAKTLREAGLDQRQAEGVAGVVRDGRAGLATKADLDTGLAAVRADFRADIAALEARLETKIEHALNRTLLAIMALNTILFAAMKFL